MSTIAAKLGCTRIGTCTTVYITRTRYIRPTNKTEKQISFWSNENMELFELNAHKA